MLFTPWRNEENDLLGNLNHIKIDDGSSPMLLKNKWKTMLSAMKISMKSNNE